MSATQNEFAEGVEKPITQFECRTCLKIIGDGNSNHLFQLWTSPWNPKTKSIIAQDLTKLSGVEVLEADSHSKLICQKCCLNLYNACQFITSTKASDQLLKERQVKCELPKEFMGKPWPKPIQVDKEVNSGVFGRQVEVEIKQEVMSEEEQFNSDGVDPETDETPQIKVTVNGTISLAEMGKHSTIVTNGSEIFEDVEFLDSVKEEPLTDDEELQNLDLPLDCLLCSKDFKSLSGLKAHVISHHSYKSVRRKASGAPSPDKRHRERHVCASCKRSFSTRTDLMVHETCHNKATCFGCDDKFDTFTDLLRHRKRCRTIINNNKDVAKPRMLGDVIRSYPEISLNSILEKSVDDEAPAPMMKCSLCPETFSDQYYMKIHHEIHHSSEQAEEHKIEEKTELTSDAEIKALQTMFEQKDEKVKIEIEIENIQPKENPETEPVDIQLETKIKVGEENTDKSDEKSTEESEPKIETVNGVNSEEVVEDVKDKDTSMEVTPIVSDKMDIENTA